jgi:F-type H+-transporting ATPase subunit epsilon
MEGGPVTLHVELVVPDREIWSGSARMVIAKTLDGDIGVMGSHPPVIGLLAEGSLVRILDAQASGSRPGVSGGTNGPDGRDGSDGRSDRGGPGDATGELVAAVSGGFLSVAGDRVSILARHAELGRDVDTSATKAELDESSADRQPGGEEPSEIRYARARLRAAGEQA